MCGRKNSMYNIIYLVQILSVSAVYTFYDSTGASSAPVVRGTLSVSPGIQYSVKVEIIQADLNSGNEYATITIGDENFGNCGNSAAQCQCDDWYDCSNDLDKGNFLASSGQIAVEVVAKYSNAVNCCACEYGSPSVNTLGIIRITLTKGSLLFYHIYDLQLYFSKMKIKIISLISLTVF